MAPYACTLVRAGRQIAYENNGHVLAQIYCLFLIHLTFVLFQTPNRQSAPSRHRHRRQPNGNSFYGCQRVEQINVHFANAVHTIKFIRILVCLVRLSARACARAPMREHHLLHSSRSEHYFPSISFEMDSRNVSVADEACGHPRAHSANDCRANRIAFPLACSLRVIVQHIGHLHCRWPCPGTHFFVASIHLRWVLLRRTPICYNLMTFAARRFFRQVSLLISHRRRSAGIICFI